VAKLWDANQQARGNSFSELSADEFVPRFIRAWTRAFEFQASRGLYERAGDRFVATAKMGLRSALEFHLHLRHRSGMRYALTVMAAVVAFAFAASAVARSGSPFAVPVMAAIAGAIFAFLFKHFELPAVLAICGLAVALDRDDTVAIVVFLFVLLQGAILLQRRRAAKAAARMAISAE
jgi:preprotein translocase subunit SecG